ncbi:MAG: (2Fe-2S) ferredoxin domain-containing protein [Halanaerobiales bacterium]
MKSLEELREMRKEVEKDMQMRKSTNKPKVIIGMGTCGIAAGAREILQTVMEEMDKRDLEIEVTQTGCIGMCEKEPLMDVKLPGKDRITYGNLDKEAVKRIIVNHVINGNVIDELVIARLEE